MGRALEVATISIGERLGIWEGVGVTGEIARVKCTFWMEEEIGIGCLADGESFLACFDDIPRAAAFIESGVGF